MSEIKRYMTEKQRLQFAISFMISRLQYGDQFPTSKKVTVRREYHAAIMSVARWAKNNYCFKQSVISICKLLKLEIPWQQLLKMSAKFMHNTNFSRRPKQISTMIRFPRSGGQAKLGLKYRSKNEKYDRNLIVRSVKIYNTLPKDIKQLLPKKFNKAIRRLWNREDQE